MQRRRLVRHHLRRRKSRLRKFDMGLVLMKALNMGVARAKD
ncbi:hypothetical protein Hanom_Chr04g00352631 [Helianthus anomalus]